MKVASIKTEKITPRTQTIFKVLDKYLTDLSENSVLAVTSKIIAICEGRAIKIGEANKKDLIYQEAELVFPPEMNKYDISITIKDGILIPTAGIDESNGNGYYILWPKDPQKSANEIRAYLGQRFGVKNLGVIITDSKTTPLRWGTTGITIAHSGFAALNDYIGQPDIFGHRLRVTKASVMDGLAGAAVLVMGEGQEQTPIAKIEEVPFVHFQDRDPSGEELEALHINLKDDLYAPLLTSVKWDKGRSK